MLILIYQQITIRAIDISEYCGINGIMHNTHKEETANDSEKVHIILLANAVVQPSAMMIKPIDTPVALATMLRGVLHMCVAHFTE